MGFLRKTGAFQFLIMIFSVSVLAEMPGKGRIIICSDKVISKVSPLTTGACLEDVNHEVYGGIYSQMIFGESFEEPPPSLAIEGFMYEGPGFDLNQSKVQWQVHESVLCGPESVGAKLLAKDIIIEDGYAEVQIRFDGLSPGVAGFVIHVSDSGAGADNFNGYEISLDPSTKQVILGKHKHDWNLLRKAACPINISEWITLGVEFNRGQIKISVNGKDYIRYVDKDNPLVKGLVGFRTWQREAKFRNFRIKTAEGAKHIPFQYVSNQSRNDQVSNMWTGFRKGGAEGEFAIELNNSFNGRHSQRITFQSGLGSVGIANSGLNHRGMYFQKDRDYEGIIRIRSDGPVNLGLALENHNGTVTYGKTNVSVKGSDWQRIEFTLISSDNDENGRFCIYLTEPGSVVIGYSFLQPGEWGRYKGLPVRLDVAEGLIDQKLTVLRYGGCMANASEYRWKKMVGPRDMRPPYKGWWYPYSSNGWGIIDFINFCEAADFECIPDFNIEESAKDMADFVEYIHGSSETEWGQKRAAEGHPEPYSIKYIQIGNEETVDEHYVERFKLLAEAIWSKDPDIIPVVGDFAYNEHIDDPYNLRGAPRITTLAAHREILRFAKAHNKSVWFDVHIWNHDPRDPDRLDKGMGIRSFIAALEAISDGADFKVCVFEENATNHKVRRGLAHAHAINEIHRFEHEIPILCAANCLQPDGQNDNGWDQGLLFLSQSKVWGQPSYYVTQMTAENYQPLCVESFVESYNDALDVTACKSLDGKTISLRVVNLDCWDVRAKIDFMNYVPSESYAEVIQIKGNLEDSNTVEDPRKILPTESKMHIEKGSADLEYTFPAYSYTVLNFN